LSKQVRQTTEKHQPVLGKGRTKRNLTSTPPAWLSAVGVLTELAVACGPSSEGLSSSPPTGEERQKKNQTGGVRKRTQSWDVHRERSKKKQEKNTQLILVGPGRVRVRGINDNQDGTFFTGRKSRPRCDGTNSARTRLRQESDFIRKKRGRFGRKGGHQARGGMTLLGGKSLNRKCCDV